MRLRNSKQQRQRHLRHELHSFYIQEGMFLPHKNRISYLLKKISIGYNFCQDNVTRSEAFVYVHLRKTEKDSH